MPFHGDLRLDLACMKMFGVATSPYQTFSLSTDFQQENEMNRSICQWPCHRKPTRLHCFIVLTFSAIISLTSASELLADQWPQWMGPDRDNIWKESGILKRFPADGPKVVWRQKIAGGYSGPAVVDGKVFITDYVTSDDVKIDNFSRDQFSGVERVLCLNEETGGEIWKHETPVDYGISYPAGPRCTPCVEGNRVYTLGAEGNLFCLNVENGDVVWEHDLKKEYNTKSALWGYAAHPLIDGDKLITLAGGEGSHVVAFDKNTGKEIWKSSTSPEQGYSPPTIINAGGVRQLILCRPNAVSAVNPDDGSEYWSVPYEATNGSIIMSPVRVGNYLYVAGYQRQSLLLELDEDKPAAKVVWRNKARDAISPVNVQPIVDGDVVYGMNEDGVLAALKLPDGKRLWDTPQPVAERKLGTGTAFIVRQADRYWFFTETGDLVIGNLDEEGFTELDRCHVIEPSNLAFGRKVVWSMPAFANKRIYLRNDNEIICLDVSE